MSEYIYRIIDINKQVTPFSYIRFWWEDNLTLGNSKSASRFYMEKVIFDDSQSHNPAHFFSSESINQSLMPKSFFPVSQGKRCTIITYDKYAILIV